MFRNVSKTSLFACLALTVVAVIGSTQSAQAQIGGFYPVGGGFGPVTVTPLPIVGGGFPQQPYPTNPSFGSNPYGPQIDPGFGGYPSGGGHLGFGGNPYQPQPFPGGGYPGYGQQPRRGFHDLHPDTQGKLIDAFGNLVDRGLEAWKDRNDKKYGTRTEPVSVGKPPVVAQPTVSSLGRW
jgi:hypothetical protein